MTPMQQTLLVVFGLALLGAATFVLRAACAVCEVRPPGYLRAA